MKKIINIIQFLPYFPPHKGGLETHAEEWGKWWVKKWYWDVYNVITEFEQEIKTSPQPSPLEEREQGQIIFGWEVIWYKKDWYEVLVCPSFEIISNFPVYKFWCKKYKLIIKYLKLKKVDVVITRTRFFLTSFLWWLYAKRNKIEWCHIEHGSDYVKLNNNFKNTIAKVYDRVIWKWIFNNSNKLIGVSEACKKFIIEEFSERKIDVIYRWIELNESNIKKILEINLVYIWRLVTLKWVDYLLKAYKKSNISIKLSIFWDGPQKLSIEKYAKDNNLNVEFLWFQDREYIINFLYINKCILINPSFQEWLPSTVIECLMTWNIAIASNVWWTSEISDMDDLILFKVGDIKQLSALLISTILNYDILAWKSKELVINRFSWDRNIDVYYELLKYVK